MKRLLHTYLLPALLVAFPITITQAQDAIVEDNDAPDAPITYVTLAWDPNPEHNIVGYNVYYGRAAGRYARLVTVTETTATIGIRARRTTYFAVTAFDSNGLESDFSNEVQWP
jgi:fibronectin type 3 domain-containing protein